ncbi:MAG: MFS transporter [Ktedonobacteraceae bacterium]|nr:MFS transporter [Ktedonobacteraceae bacterium]
MSEAISSAAPAPQPAKKSAGGYAMYVFFVLFIISALNNMDRYVLTGAANLMSRELHLKIDDICYLSSAFIIFFTLSVIPLGIWADRAKRKNVIAVSLAIWSLATAFTALANSFVTLFISRMVLGIGEAGYSPSSAALISDYFSRPKRATVMSWWATSALVGLMGGLILGGTVAALYPGAWRLAFLFTGIPGLVMALVAWRLREPRRNQADEEDTANRLLPVGTLGEVEDSPYTIHLSGNMRTQFKSLLRIKTLLVLIGIQIFSFFVLSGTVTYLSIYLQQKDTVGLSSVQAGLYTGFGIVIAGGIGMVIGGYLSNLLNRRYAGARVMICGLSFLLSAPCYLASVLVAINTHNLGLYSIFFVLTTIIININSGPAGAAIQDVVPSSLRASAVAISLFIGHLLGDTFAPSLLGKLAASFDPSGQHFAQGVAGHDLSNALLVVYPTSLIIAGLIGIIGSRWMKGDIQAAQLAEQAARNVTS